MRAVTYEPDEHDELVSDAFFLGGSAFVEALHWEATEAAGRIHPWSGDGEEPHEYRSAWLAAARHIVDGQRAAEAAQNALMDMNSGRPAS